MLRIITREQDSNDAAHIGGETEITYRTFDAEAPEVEAWLRQKDLGYVSRTVIGIELVEGKQSEPQ